MVACPRICWYFLFLRRRLVIIISNSNVTEMVVPMTSFFFCFQGLVLILRAIGDTDAWSTSYNMHVYEVLDAYYSNRASIASR